MKTPNQTHNAPAIRTADQTPAPRAAGRHYLDAKSKNTQIAYRAALRDFAAALEIKADAIQPQQIDDAALCAYIAARAERHKPATIAARVSTLRSLAKDSGFPVLGDQHRDALKAVARAQGVAPKQAQGFRLASYYRALANLPDDMRGLRDAALLTLAYSTAGRASELVSYRFEDIDAEARTILLRRSKTDQDGCGALKHLSPDAIKALAAWRAASGIESGAILRSVNKGGRVGDPLTTRALAKIVKRLLGDDYSPHSIRVGFVQSAVEKGLTIPQIGLTTGQSPQTVQRYYAKADQRNSAAAKMLG